MKDETGHREERSHGLLGVGGDLSRLSRELVETLQHDWKDAIGESNLQAGVQVANRSTAAATQYGQRLGELRAPLDDAEEMIKQTLSTSQRTSEDKARRDLQEKGARAWFLLHEILPKAFKDQQDLQRTIADLAGRQASVRAALRFRWHRFLFYLLPGVLVLGAEWALAENVTTKALRISQESKSWMFLPIALLCLPLIFKELLDWEELGRIPKAYLLSMVLLFMAVLVPLSWLRTEQVLVGAGGGISISNPFAPVGSVAGGGQAPVPKISFRTWRDIGMMTLVFVGFGLLFPLVSGLGFHRAWILADSGTESFLLGRGMKKARDENVPHEKKMEKHWEELIAIQNSMIGQAAALGNCDDFVEKVLADLVGELREVGDGTTAILEREIEKLRDRGWRELAKQIALRVSTLNLRGDRLLDLRVQHQQAMLSGIAQIAEGRSYQKIAEALEKRAVAALRDGHTMGVKAPFARMESHPPRDILELIRLRRLRDALFHGRWSGGPES